MSPLVHRRPERFLPDSSRVLIRPFIPVSAQRIVSIISRVQTLSDAEVTQTLSDTMGRFRGRHLRIEEVFLRHFQKVSEHWVTDLALPSERQLLIGAYFTSEYALESAALFNPSIVPHPDQTGVEPGSLRFILSLRATGEGHISSIEFRSGTINEHYNLTIDPVRRHVTTPQLIPNPVFERSVFRLKLHEMGFQNEHSVSLLEPLAEVFSLSHLQTQLQFLRTGTRLRARDEIRTLECAQWLAESNYEISFEPEIALSERIIFPVSANESNGIEDARFVHFTDEDGSRRYYATYTAYNGRVILPQLIETNDFLHFKIVTLNGPAAQNKGMALFPRKVGGRFAMISRQDNENIFLMYSDNPHFWYDAKKLLRPTQSWEFVQLGNCGSPIETEAGWLLLTHGVGPMRRYCIGAILLDLEDPSKVIGRLRDPLLQPEENEREGYVPNVVYSCGALLFGREVVIPYAMSDSASGIATVKLDELLAAMV